MGKSVQKAFLSAVYIQYLLHYHWYNWRRLVNMINWNSLVNDLFPLSLESLRTSFRRSCTKRKENYCSEVWWLTFENKDCQQFKFIFLDIKSSAFKHEWMVFFDFDLQDEIESKEDRICVLFKRVRHLQVRRSQILTSFFVRFFYFSFVQWFESFNTKKWQTLFIDWQGIPLPHHKHLRTWGQEERNPPGDLSCILGSVWKRLWARIQQ